MPTEQDLNRLFGVFIGNLNNGRSLTSAMTISARAGIPYSGGQFWNQFLTAIANAFYQLDFGRKEQTLRALADQLATDGGVQANMAQLGYQYIAGGFVPVEQFDLREAQFLPTSSASEIAKAMKRLADGDESGAITSACGAVDTLMGAIYEREGLGDPGHTAFAAKVGTAIGRMMVFENMASELVESGMDQTTATKVAFELRKSTSHAAEMLQTLRPKMGDVHGTKPALRRMAYDAIKWASAICGLFDER